MTTQAPDDLTHYMEAVSQLRAALLPFLTPSPEHPMTVDEESDRVSLSVSLDEFEAAQRLVP
jgi:hypothetical protein